MLFKEKYLQIVWTMGKKAVHSMCVQTFKKGSTGNPVHAKSQIVVLGNKDPMNWSKADCYAPVVAQPMVWMLAALSIKFCSTLKQGDCKNAFVQVALSEREFTIIHPPASCPCSDLDTFWWLQNHCMA